MTLKQKPRNLGINTANKTFSFIAPHPLERCHSRILSLRKLSFSFPQTSVVIDNIGHERFFFQVTRLIGRGRQATISGEITPQTEQTTLVTAKLQEVPLYWCMAIPLYGIVVGTSIVGLTTISRGEPATEILCGILFMWIFIFIRLFQDYRAKKHFIQQFSNRLIEPLPLEELKIQLSKGDVY